MQTDSTVTMTAACEIFGRHANHRGNDLQEHFGRSWRIRASTGPRGRAFSTSSCQGGRVLTVSSGRVA